jgi:hypothetical protein
MASLMGNTDTPTANNAYGSRHFLVCGIHCQEDTRANIILIITPRDSTTSYHALHIRLQRRYATRCWCGTIGLLVPALHG